MLLPLAASQDPLRFEARGLRDQSLMEVTQIAVVNGST